MSAKLVKMAHIIQNQGPGRYSDKICAESATKDTPIIQQF